MPKVLATDGAQHLQACHFQERLRLVMHPISHSYEAVCEFITHLLVG